MKKLGYTLLTLVLSIIMIPMVFAKDEVKIESYELVENSKTTTELSDPKIDGLNISFDLSFGNVKDYAKYKIVVTNPTKTDYEITKDVDFDISDYITYSYEFEKDNNIVNANDKLTMYIVVTYSKEVPADKLVDGKYIENNKMAISLASDTSSTSKEENPNTSSSILLICVLGLSIALLSLILFGKTKKKRYITTFMLSLLLIPTTIFALEKITINVETKVTIEKKYSVKYRMTTSVKKSEQDKCIVEEKIKKKLAHETYLIDGEEYINCEIYTEPAYYAAGEIVSVNRVPYNYISVFKETSSGTFDLCDFDNESFTYNCPKEALREDYYDYIRYGRSYNPEVKPNELDIINIKSITYNDWEIGGFVEFHAPNTFTMPEHDVILLATSLDEEE